MFAVFGGGVHTPAYPVSYSNGGYVQAYPSHSTV